MDGGRLKKTDGLIGILSPSDGLSGNLSQPKSLNGAISVSAVRYITELDYEKLINHPRINNVELIKNKNFDDLGLGSLSNIEIESLLS
mgnify:CR=1 FL=1